MKQLITALFLIVALTGCGVASNPTTPEEAETETKSFTIDLPDGRTVLCVTYDDANYGTELSCDWEHAK